MALYVALSLLAVIAALPAGALSAEAYSPAIVVGLTALGLLGAHWLAFRISTGLLFQRDSASAELELLAAQLVGGIGVAALAVLPLLVAGASIGLVLSQLLLTGTIAIAAYASARPRTAGRGRALLYTAVVVVITGAVVALKNLVGA